MRKVTIAACLLASIAHAQSPLTNTDVIRMVAYGISPSLVKATIFKSKSAFDLSPDGLIQLKKSGLNDDIVLAMLSKSNSGVSTSSYSSAIGDTLHSMSAGIYYLTGGTYRYMQPGILETVKFKGLGGAFKKSLGGFISLKTNASIGRSNSLMEGKERRPAFLFILDYPVHDPEEFFLVRLLCTDTSRQLLIGKPANGTGTIIIGDSLKFDFTARKLETGYYEVIPAHPLPPGEYGFVYRSPAFYSGTSFRIFDFSIPER